MSGITLIVNIIIAISLAVNAKKHFKSSILWAILGFIFGISALGVYLIQIGNKVLGWILLVPSVILNLFILITFLFMSAIGM